MLMEDFTEILLRHKLNEMEALTKSNKVLFIDTDALTTQFYLNFLESSKAEDNLALSDAIDRLNTYDLIRRSLLLIIGSGIPLVLSALTHSNVILIIAAFFWLIFTLAGIGIIASELGERRKKKPVKKYSDIAPKIRTCETCGKTLQKNERQYCDRCRLAMERFSCAGCGRIKGAL